jgi:hypothetical protein
MVEERVAAVVVAGVEEEVAAIVLVESTAVVDVAVGVALT